jgi:dTDP-4-dehydrorhamnose reductase
MRFLILGSSGLLGNDLVDEWQAEDVVAATSRDADIRDISQVRRLVTETRPDWILDCAAFADVDGSEKDPQRAFSINRDGTKNVATVANESGAKLFYVSTDYVFDGRSNRPYEPADPAHPLNAYGASKLAGEDAVRQIASHWVIARTSWLFGASGSCFPEKILLAAEAQSELKVVNDQIGSPTYTKDLARGIHELVLKNANGIVHITNAGSCSRFEFAKAVLQKAGRTTPAIPTTTAETHRLAPRPSYSVLSPASLAIYGITLRHWQEALGTYLGELRRKGKLR